MGHPPSLALSFHFHFRLLSDGTFGTGVDQNDRIHFYVGCLHAVRQRITSGPHRGNRTCCCSYKSSLGQAPCLLSFAFFWQGATQALLAMETQYFPDLPCETPSRLAAPHHLQPLSRVKLSSWNCNHRLIAPAFLAVNKFKKWFETNYSVDTHADILSLCDDSLLLIETIADICDVVIHNTDSFEA